MRGILAGALALVTLHTLVTYQGANGRIAGAFSGMAGLVDRFLDPTRPAIPARKPDPAPAAGVTARATAPTYPAPAYHG